MPLTFDDDPSQFFRKDEFAEEWTVAGSAVLAIFNDGYAEDQDIEGTNPELVCQSDTLPVDLASGVTAVSGLSGATYSVVGVRPDGTGFTYLDLELVSA